MKISWVPFSSWQKTSGDYDNNDDVSKEMREAREKYENYFNFKHNEGMKKDDMYLMVHERIRTDSRVFEIV